MLFNSHFFIFAFLPASLFVYFALGRLSRDWALRWIIVTSLIFYAWWRPGNVFIIVPAMLVNFTVAKLILYYVREEKATVTKLLLTSGIVFNLVVLGYFKYTNFLLAASNDVFGSGFVFKEIVLPLGISFITFQMIAFLVDVHGRKIESFRFQDFFFVCALLSSVDRWTNRSLSGDDAAVPQRFLQVFADRFVGWYYAFLLWPI